MKKINLNGAQTVHFIGIGGISMSGLAEILRHDGYTVRGTDATPSETTRLLTGAGISVIIPHSEKNITKDIDLIVYTAAIKAENPEFRAAQNLGIKMIDRAELMEAVMAGYKYSIAIAGTHGKTTTTSMTAQTLLEAGLDPTIQVGGYMSEGFNYKVGNSPYFVMEACEYANSFLQWHPYIGVILNIDSDHLEFFGSMKNIINSFARFASNIHPDGALIINAETPGLDIITQNLRCKVFTFNKGGDFILDDVTLNTGGEPSFNIMKNNENLGRVDLPMPGIYNAYNALACAAVSDFLDIKAEAFIESLSNFKGVRRRFEKKGEYNGAVIIDDYAHHPTEIMACLKAAKDAVQPGGKIICLFQPHTYSRTKNLLTELSESFSDADEVILLPIYAAREPDDGTISSKILAERITDTQKSTTLANSFHEADEILRNKLHKNDLLITMGAGDVFMVGEGLLST